MKAKYEKIIIEMTNREAKKLLEGIRRSDNIDCSIESQAALNNLKVELKRICKEE